MLGYTWGSGGTDVKRKFEEINTIVVYENKKFYKTIDGDNPISFEEFINKIETEYDN